MNKFIFISTNVDGAKTTVEFEATCLDEIFPYFDQFLKGCGYSYDGDITIIDIDVEPAVQD